MVYVYFSMSDSEMSSPHRDDVNPCALDWLLDEPFLMYGDRRVNTSRLRPYIIGLLWAGKNAVL